MPGREMTEAESELINQLNEAIDRNDTVQISRLFEFFKDKCGDALADSSSCPPAFYKVEDKLVLKGVRMDEPFPDALRNEVDIAPAAAAAAPAAEPVHGVIVLYENPVDALPGAMGLSGDMKPSQD